MNTATVRGRHVPKHPPISNAPVIASLRRNARGTIFFSEELHHRWEQIVSKERA